MTMKLEGIISAKGSEVSFAWLEAKYEQRHAEPSASYAGVSFPLIPKAIGLAAVIALTVVGGTIEARPLPATNSLRFVLSGKPLRTTSALDRYKALRDRIESEGTPLLDDEGIRVEIKDRRRIRE